MFNKLVVALIAAAATVAPVSAAPQPILGSLLGGVLGGHHAGDVATTTSNNGNIQNSCNTGPVQCCNQTFSANGSHASLLRSLLGIDVGDITAMVGLQCTPITALVGLGSGASCSSQPVCCSGNTFNGLINIGCTPLNVAL